MKIPKNYLWILIVLVLAGCSIPLSIPDGMDIPFLTGTDTPTPAWTVSPTPTPLPTSTPTPTPTPMPVIRIEQAEWAIFRGDYETARQEYEISFVQAQDDETRAAALVGLGNLDRLESDCPQAIEAFQNVFEVYPLTQAVPNAYFFLGECYLTMGNYIEAAEAYQNYLDLKPGVMDAYLQEKIGDVLRLGGEYSGAIEAYQQAIDATVIGDTLGIEVKIAKTLFDAGDCNRAVAEFIRIYDTSNNDYVKAEMDLLSGQCYLALGFPEQAYARFQDAVNQYPLSRDSYWALVALVDAGQPVDDLARGLVDYYAQQYGLAMDAFKRYLENIPDHDGTAHFFMGMSLVEMGQYEAAILEFQSLIDGHPGDAYWKSAYEEKAYILWAFLGRYEEAAQALLDYVARVPNSPDAANLLYQAARVKERSGDLEGAASTWERIVNEYPSDEQSLRGLFLSGICYYRLQDYGRALLAFQRMLVLSPDPEDQAAAYFWIGKTQMITGETEAANSAWQQASVTDVTGFYSERAREIQLGLPPLTLIEPLTLEFDLDSEEALAEAWLRSTFAIPGEVSLEGLGALAGDPRMKLANELWNLGLYSEAVQKFEVIRQENSSDAVTSYRLMQHLLNLGAYKQAILTCRQILDLANLSDADTLNVPKYFSHIRFGLYYKDDVFMNANLFGLQPILLFSVIRQESLFEGHAGSTAGAMGLMQLIPSTAESMAAQLGWPPNYSTDDLYRPVVNLRLGTRYLERQVKSFGEDQMFAALAAYNAGPGNASIWFDLANGDPDLFVEIIRYSETRNYVMNIAEFFYIYQRIYANNQS